MIRAPRPRPATSLAARCSSLCFALLLALPDAGPALAETDPQVSPAPGSAAPEISAPGPLILSPRISLLETGIFCALKGMDRAPAPDTISGWLHVPRERIDFDWPGETIVPASIGLAFGLRFRAAPGLGSDSAEVLVWRPGRETPESWQTSLPDTDSSIAFFRFDEPAELIEGIWRFEIRDQGEILLQAAFEVVPAGARRAISDACGATS